MILIVRILPDGHLAIATEDALIKIFDITTGELIRAINSDVHSLAVLTDGNLACGTKDGEIPIWDPMTGILIKTIKVRNITIDFLSVVSNGNIAIGVGADKEMEIWDPRTGKLVRKFSNNVHDFIEVSDGIIVTLCWRNETFSLEIWDHTTGKLIRKLPLKKIEKKCKKEDVCFFADGMTDGKLVIGCDVSGEILIVDIASGRLIRTIKCDPFECLEVFSDGTVASGHNDGVIRIWNPVSGKLIRLIVTQHIDIKPLKDIVELTEGRIACTFKDSIEIYNFRTGL